MRQFNRQELKLRPLARRIHELDVSCIKKLRQVTIKDPLIQKVACSITSARRHQKTIVLMMGAHVLRAGVQRYLIDLMKRGYLSGIAINGAGVIHDFEFALIGATTESVARYIAAGQFGLWEETGRINDIINAAYQRQVNSGFGEAVGKAISEGDYRYKSLSLLAAAYDLDLPVTVHVGIGYDIIHELPNFDGAATGALSYNDFLTFTSLISNLENGVVMNFGSAVMAPEVFLKALSMARNVEKQKNREISRFTTMVCDLHELPDNTRIEPNRENPYYYFRPWKTMLTRTVADGGQSYYIKGRHEDVVPSLWTALNMMEKDNEDTHAG